ncbi:hypothetical protein [Fulvivirga sp.]|uniref:glycosyl-4,4'-diaponeurosporenoate acyltransferase CrtO family protein n=1 Tax=Fulvivirga sp. TaxID=1931237 RepID=UPI0032F07299
MASFKTTILNWYLKPKNIEAEGRLYEKIGINSFKKITPFEILGFIKNRKMKTLNNSTLSGVKKYFRDTISGELAHLASLFFLFALATFFTVKGLLADSLILVLINILVNLYPIFLVRYNRLRIAKVLKKEVLELLIE